MAIRSGSRDGKSPANFLRICACALVVLTRVRMRTRPVACPRHVVRDRNNRTHKLLWPRMMKYGRRNSKCMQELKRRAGATASSLVEKPSFQPNPDNVIVAMPPKNGTTWVLHICHQIRMQGQEPDFDDQNDVIGLIELLEIAAKTGKKLESLEQPAKPPFTTHTSSFQREGKSFTALEIKRMQFCPITTFLIYLSHSEGARVSLPVFTQHLMLERVELYLKDLLVWWDHRHDDNLLVLFFDDLKENHEGCVCRIAKFMGVKCDDIIARVVYGSASLKVWCA